MKFDKLFVFGITCIWISGYSFGYGNGYSYGLNIRKTK